MTKMKKKIISLGDETMCRPKDMLTQQLVQIQDLHECAYMHIAYLHMHIAYTHMHIAHMRNAHAYLHT